MRHRAISVFNFSLVALLAAGSGCVMAAGAADNSVESAPGKSIGGTAGNSVGGASAGSVEGASGGSVGSPGMEDTEATFKDDVKASARKSTTDSAYAESLIELGLYYNRHDRFADAQRTLRKALGVIDHGALKPSPAVGGPEKPRSVVHHANGVVTAREAEPPAPYESTLQNLLPALITAETETGQFKPAEAHLKRLIEVAQSGKVPRVPTLMFAYNQYAELMTKQGRTKDASEYKAKANEINSHIIGL